MKLKDTQVRLDMIDIHFTIANYEINLMNISYEPPRYPWHIESHSHNTYEIHFIPHGNGTLQCNGLQYPITENTFYITGPGIMHKQISTEELPMSEYCINLDFERRKKRSGQYDSMNEMNEMIGILLENRFYIGTDTFGGAMACIEIIEEINNVSLGCNTYLALSISRLIVSIARSIMQNNEQGASLTTKDYNISRKRILDSILRHYRSQISPEELAKQLRVTKRQISRIMQNVYGMSLTQKINDLRIDCAKELLHTTQMSIAQIAQYVGYSTAQYFCIIFKQTEKKTPSQYRKSSKD